MKSFLLLFVLAVFTAAVPAQELDSLKAIMGNKQQEPQPENRADNGVNVYTPVVVNENGDTVKVIVGNNELVKVVDGSDSTYVSVGSNKILEVIDSNDSTRIRVGDKEISIVEKGDNAVIHFGDVDRHMHKKARKFRGHWTGFEWGINNFLDDDFTLSREGEEEFMDINTGRSWSINLNIAQYSLGFGSSQVGAVTGLGLEYNNYFFDNSNSIVEENDQVVPDTLEPTYLSKSKLTACFLRVPVIIEVQFPGSSSRSKRAFISAGAITGLKLGSHTKVVYEDDNGKNKDKNKDDFNINPFRFGLTARIGFGNVNLFGDYYFTSMFVEGKGPSLHPFSVGLSLTF
jgi:hypothetical protein